MKHHLSDIHVAGPHPHLHSFFHRTHEHAISDSWTVKHPTLVSLAITCLIAGMVTAFLLMFHTHQLTGAWPLMGG